MKILTLFIGIFHFSLAHGAILVEENGREVVYDTRSASDGMDLRTKRRMGVGAAAAGAHGVFGINIDLNLTSRITTELGFGLSTEFQTFHFAVKRYLGGESVLPYIGLGYARWSNNGETRGGIEETNPGFVAEQFMSEEDKEKGRITANILYPAAGIQYLLLDGRWAGFGIHAEIDILLEVSELEAAPTGSIGATYYF